MLAHLRQISLLGGSKHCLSWVPSCYVDRQPELLFLLYDELDQERPKQITIQFSPSGSPSSNLGSAAPGSYVGMPPPPVFTTPARNKSSNLARSLRVRLNSFDSSLTRQINIGTGSRERKNLNVATTGTMTKSKLSSKVLEKVFVWNLND